MPRLTVSKVRMNEGERLPPKILTLSKKGGTSLVYVDAADPVNVVQVYTIEYAKADYWRHMNFSTETDIVGSATLRGWPYTYPYYDSRVQSETYDLYKCIVPHISFDFTEFPALKKERNAAIKLTNKLFMDNIHESSRELLIWEELADCDIECLRDGADFALNYNCDLYVQNPRDALCIWNDKLFWLDPYHERGLLEMIRATAHPRQQRGHY